jgi:hypothetical protein
MRELNVTLLYETTLALTHCPCGTLPLCTIAHLGSTLGPEFMDQLLCWWPVRNHPQPWLYVAAMSGPGVVRTQEACLYTVLELINCSMSLPSS